MSATGIPNFDPDAPKGLLARGMDRFIRSKAGRLLAMKVATRVDPVLLRISHGRIGMGLTLPSANLTTRGAKSGLPRTVAVLYFSDGPDVILIASSFGREKHPAWYHNLKANPQAVLERSGATGRYEAEEVHDEAERERLFAQADKVYSGYADYREMTAAVGRRIPIMRLKLAGA
jgi:deazaflavin-dependent oxidoreductase (nitroreductase family)